MTRRERDRSLGDGVYFAADDYLGFGPRILIFVVDAVVLVAGFFFLTFLWAVVAGEPSGVYVAVVIVAVWLYQVPLKRSRFRTLGYRLAGARLVTLRGERPSLLMMTLRSLLWLLGPFSFLFDLIWCGIDDDRQTLRDRYTYMCLVKGDAIPIGAGEVHLAYFTAFGYNLAYPHVVHPKAAEPG